MPQGDTRIRILDAAERLFTDQGLKGFSLRAVTELAGMNLAAVNYYFGSKDELIYAMTQRHFSVVTSENTSANHSRCARSSWLMRSLCFTPLTRRRRVSGSGHG